MVFIKVTKNRAYFSRFQTKYRRRREGKTDYKARRRLVAQDKNKYNTPRYRLVVRITNRDVICQVVMAKVVGDDTVMSAYAHELPLFGAPVGLTNYAACYATGLLLARRALTKYNRAEKYQGATPATGEDFLVELEDSPRPFKAILDIGLAGTTTGARVFAAMKGALDGGLNIPHSPKRFFGFKGDNLDSGALRGRLFGLHVADYQKKLQGEDAEKYNKAFSRYIKAGVKPEGVEAMWQKTHEAIRKDPTKKKDKKKTDAKPKNHANPRRNTADRKHIRTQRKAAFARRLDDE